MNNKKTLCSLLLISLFSILGLNELMAQDSKVPGGDQRYPLGAEMRNGKLVFESENGDFRWWFDSRIQFDGAMYFENKNAMSNGVHLRRATFALKALLWKDWQAEVDIDFAEAVSTNLKLNLEICGLNILSLR